MARPRPQAFYLTYRLSAGRGVHVSATAEEAIEDHSLLMTAGAREIVVRNAKGLVVLPSEVAARAKADKLGTRNRVHSVA